MFEKFFEYPSRIKTLCEGPVGHANMQTTAIYTRVDPSVKLEALDSIVPPKLRSGRFKATDKLVASLKAGTLMRSKIASI